MSCQAYEELLSAYIDGELTSEEVESLEAHLATCDSCRSALSELRAVKSAISSIPEEKLPLGLHEMIMVSAVVEKRGFLAAISQKLSGWTVRQWVPVVAAAMVLVMFVSAGGGAWYANRKQSLESNVSEGLTQGKSPGIASYRTAAPEAAPAPSPTADAGFAGTKSMLTADTRVSESAEILMATDRKIIKRAQLALEVSRGSVKQSSELAMNAVKANFGYIESSSIAEADQVAKQYTSFYMVARVPSENLDAAIEALSALGRATRQDTSAQDVTDQYVDLDARMRNKENQEQRLLTIMGEAKTVGELLQVEGELSRVRGEIETMKAQIQNYDKSVAMSSLSLTLTEEGAVKPPSPSPWSDVWKAFVNAWRNLLMFAAKGAPTIIILGAIAGLTVWVLRRRA